MSKFYRFKRATKTFGDLSKPEIKEIIRNGRSSGVDWFGERYSALQKVYYCDILYINSV